LVISDPRVDHQAVTEASYVNIPVISFTNTDAPLKFIDIAIPCNNKGRESIGLMWWFLAREVLLLKGKMTRQTGFVLDDKLIMPDLYFYRDPEEQEKEQEVAEVIREPKEPTWGGSAIDTSKPDEFPTTAEPVKLDFQMPAIEDWAAASSWDNNQPAAPAAPQGQWGAPADNNW